MNWFLELVSKNDFWKIILSNVFGFCFALVLFLFSQCMKNIIKKRNYLKSLKSEIDFNIRLINIYINNFQEWLLLINGGKNGPQEPFDFSQLQKNFFNRCLEKGYLYNKFSNEELSNIISMFSYFSIENQQWINNFSNENYDYEKDPKRSVENTFFKHHLSKLERFDTKFESFKNKL